MHGGMCGRVAVLWLTAVAICEERGNVSQAMPSLAMSSLGTYGASDHSFHAADASLADRVADLEAALEKMKD